MSKPVIAAPGQGPRRDLGEPIVIRRKASFGWKVAGAGICCAGVGYLLWSTAVSTHPIAAYVYGAMLIAIAIFGLWGGMEEAIRRPAVLLISKDGIAVFRGRMPHLIQWARRSVYGVVTSRLYGPVMACRPASHDRFRLRNPCRQPARHP